MEPHAGRLRLPWVLGATFLGFRALLVFSSRTAGSPGGGCTGHARDPSDTRRGAHRGAHVGSGAGGTLLLQLPPPREPSLPEAFSQESEGVSASPPPPGTSYRALSNTPTRLSGKSPTATLRAAPGQRSSFYQSRDQLSFSPTSGDVLDFLTSTNFHPAVKYKNSLSEDLMFLRIFANEPTCSPLGR